MFGGQSVGTDGRGIDVDAGRAPGTRTLTKGGPASHAQATAHTQCTHRLVQAAETRNFLRRLRRL